MMNTNLKVIIMKRLIGLVGLIVFLASCSNRSNKSATQNVDSLKGTNLTISENAIAANTNYSLTYWVEDAIYLFGKQNLDKTVTLIDNKNGKLIESQTTGYIVHSDEMLGEINLTRILPVAGIEKEANHIAIFSNKPADYKSNVQIQIFESDLIIYIDSLIRTTNHLDDLLKKNGGFEYTTDSELKNVLPDLIKVKTDNFDYLVATYMMFDRSTIGPKLAIMPNKKVVPLTGQCSYDFFYTYFFNGKNYIQTGSGCCDCGITGQQVFQVEEEDIQPVFEDYSYSN